MATQKNHTKLVFIGIFICTVFLCINKSLGQRSDRLVMMRTVVNSIYQRNFGVSIGIRDVNRLQVFQSPYVGAFYQNSTIKTQLEYSQSGDEFLLNQSLWISYLYKLKTTYIALESSISQQQYFKYPSIYQYYFKSQFTHQIWDNFWAGMSFSWSNPIQLNRATVLALFKISPIIWFGFEQGYHTFYNRYIGLFQFFLHPQSRFSFIGQFLLDQLRVQCETQFKFNHFLSQIRLGWGHYYGENYAISIIWYF